MEEKTTVIEAPMPAKVISYEVKEGASVKEGEVLVVLEALKMENAITSPITGVVKKINFKNGDSVKGGDILAVLA